ncbi:hypothetical protein MTO96_010398 [Rhipicephalus appendiculatus]
MEPEERALWSYATHLESLGLTHLKAADLALAFQGVGTVAMGRTVPYPTICTHNGGRRVCRIFEHLTLWNKLLWFATAELREVQPGRLAFVCQHFLGPVEENCQDRLEYTYALIHCVLANHRCVISRCTSLEQLHIDTSGLEFDEVGKLIVNLVCANCHLRELVCNKGRLLGSGNEVQARFADLKKSTTLKVLSVTNASCRSDYKVALGPLQENSTILAIDSACIELRQRCFPVQVSLCQLRARGTDRGEADLGFFVQCQALVQEFGNELRAPETEPAAILVHPG